MDETVEVKLTVQDLGLVLGCDVEVQGNHFQRHGPDDEPVFYLNHGEVVTLSAEHLMMQDDDPNQMFKPLLRPLLDMTTKEANEYRALTDICIELQISVISGEAERVRMHDLSITPEYEKADAIRMTYLIRQGFDVFGWIEKGLAIDKTTL